MATVSGSGPIQLFSTCPQSKHHGTADYLGHVAAVSRWSEEIGCTGMLIYTDNGLADPWLVAQAVLQSTATLCPLVAVQPIYLHPYAAAKMVSSLGLMYGRRLWLNLLAGGFLNDLKALGDDTPHDERYARTTEYTLILRRLLEGREPVSFHGRHYRVEGLRLTPALPADLFPGLMISGSSEAGLAAARAIGALPVRYPRAVAKEHLDADFAGASGVRLGIIARDDPAEAWAIAHHRFPSDRRGEIAHALAMKTSDSQWHRQLSVDARSDEEADPYWLHPFQTYKTFCPYLVGNYQRVAREIAAYVRRGFTSFIVDIPPARDELDHIRRTFDLAVTECET